MSDTFDKAVVLAKQYSKDVDYDADVHAIRLLVDDSKIGEITHLMLELDFAPRSTCSLTDGRVSLVFEPTYDDDTFLDEYSEDDEAPPF